MLVCYGYTFFNDEISLRAVIEEQEKPSRVVVEEQEKPSRAVVEEQEKPSRAVVEEKNIFDRMRDHVESDAYFIGSCGMVGFGVGLVVSLFTYGPSEDMLANFAAGGVIIGGIIKLYINNYMGGKEE
jgi:hypothetical protein